ncbi:GNAT family N-acetyltransferase [Emticicia sp. BO119]|uniref:GNAT family N-acetyltransferase n=1 Tax=Emticicia sp. BO119 TaxID=2757768 RepID=UPI0015EFE3DD|nr:GNAT family N-acetyltransferase [Emticicia sp. BO119]MBA4851221.1 GNAT family N-acetyltransferase [Emticicia sp. BO119]
MNITYRKATLADVPELARLRIDFLKEVQSPETHLVSEDGLNEILKDFFQQQLATGQIVAWLALADGAVVSTSGLCFSTIMPGFTLLDGRVAYIMNIYTLPGWRKKGIGKQVFYHILEAAKERNYKRILLHATEDGRPIYEKFGFKATNDEMELRLY